MQKNETGVAKEQGASDSEVAVAWRGAVEVVGGVGDTLRAGRGMKEVGEFVSLQVHTLVATFEKRRAPKRNEKLLDIASFLLLLR